jgi:hypothetical protein
LETLLPKGFGDTGNIAIQERERSILLAPDLTDSIPALVGKRQGWIDIRDGVRSLLKDEALRRQGAAYKGMTGQDLPSAQPLQPSKYTVGALGQRGGKKYRWSGSAWEPLEK